MHKNFSRATRLLGGSLYRSLAFSTASKNFVPFYQVDSFSKVPYGGNPAAVLLIPPSLTPEMNEEVMMKIAQENNLSETCFVTPALQSAPDSFPMNDSFDLKWFTPTNEVALCGHGTLAAAHSIFEEGNVYQKLTFHTLSGELVASRNNDGTEISLDFPLNIPRIVGVDDEDYETISAVAQMMLEETSGLEELDVVRLAHCRVTKKLIVHTTPRDASGNVLDVLHSLKVPSPTTVLAFHQGAVVTGVSILMSGGEEGYDFSSRYFSPWNGIPEDPVNGSSHTVLAPYWINAELGGNSRTLLARQASPRGGDIRLDADFDKRRVTLSGPASTSIRGSMIIP